MYTVLLNYFLAYPDSADQPAAMTLLACAPKTHGSSKYASVLRRAAKHFLFHHSLKTAFVAALFTKRALLTGSPHWFCSTFPNLENSLRPEIQRMMRHIGAATVDLESAISTLNGLGLHRLPSAEGAVAATRAVLTATLGDLRNCLALAEGTDVAVALSSVLYIFRAHGLFPAGSGGDGGGGGGEDLDDTISGSDVVAVLSTPPPPLRVRPRRSLSREGNARGDSKRLCTEEGLRSDEEHWPRGPAAARPEGGRGGYRGRFYDPNFKYRGRGNRVSRPRYPNGWGAGGNHYRNSRRP